MFMARRRPLLRAAMLGGAGYAVGKRAAQRSEAEQEQDARIGALEAQSAGPQAAPVQQAAPAQAPAPAAGGTDVVGKLQELANLRQSGVLSDEEFQAAKAKLLGS